MTPSKVPALNGIPQPMSPSRRSPSTSRSTATSISNNQSLFTFMHIHWIARGDKWTSNDTQRTCQSSTTV